MDNLVVFAPPSSKACGVGHDTSQGCSELARGSIVWPHLNRIRVMARAMGIGGASVSPVLKSLVS